MAPLGREGYTLSTGPDFKLRHYQGAASVAARHGGAYGPVPQSEGHHAG